MWFWTDRLLLCVPFRLEILAVFVLLYSDSTELTEAQVFVSDAHLTTGLLEHHLGTAIWRCLPQCRPSLISRESIM